MNDPHAYLHRMELVSGGIAKGADRAPKVKAISVGVKRPPEFPPRTPSGPRDGNLASAKRATGDGWKPGAAKPARSGPETGSSQGFDSPGDKRARAAGKRGIETKSASSDVGAGAAKRTSAKRANIEGNESARYQKLEKKTTRSLKGGGSEKELRAGHNQAAPLPIDPLHPAMNPLSNPQGFAATGGAAHPMVSGAPPLDASNLGRFVGGGPLPGSATVPGAPKVVPGQAQATKAMLRRAIHQARRARHQLRRTVRGGRPQKGGGLL